MSAPEIKSRGQLVSEALAGAWRSDPLPLEISENELEQIAPLLLKSGAAALVWRRLRDSDLQTSPHVLEFHQLFRHQILKSRLDQTQIEKVFRLLRAAQIEPILVKGWAIARMYPERGVRPYGDIDLCVRPQQYVAARQILKTDSRRHKVDLHRGFSSLGARKFNEMYDHSSLVKLGETKVRLLDEADHFRVLCFHLLREGAWRPLWLCDVALALETRSENFDWNRCFAGSTRNREILSCAAALAHRLLGAKIDDTPLRDCVAQLPAWAIPTVLKEWESPLPSMPRRHAAPMVSQLRRRSGIRSALTDRWPNPIEATVVVGAPFNKLPRMPLQVGAYLMRAAGFFRRAVTREA